MLGFATKEQLDWTNDEAVVAARRARAEAKDRCDTAKAQWDDTWRRWNIQGAQLAYDSPAVPFKQAYLAAEQNLAEASRPWTSLNRRRRRRCFAHGVTSNATVAKRSSARWTS